MGCSFCHFFCCRFCLRIYVPVCHRHGYCLVCYHGLPGFCRNVRSAGGLLSGISVRLFLPGGHRYVRLVRHVFHHHGYFCYRICRFYQIFHFFQISPVFHFFPDVCSVFFLLPVSLSSLEPVLLLQTHSVLQNGQNVLLDDRYLPASVFPVRNSDGFRRIFFLYYRRSVYSADGIHARYSFSLVFLIFLYFRLYLFLYLLILFCLFGCSRYLVAGSHRKIDLFSE